MNKQNIPLIILIALLGLIILGGSAFVMYMATSKKETTKISTQSSAVATSPSAVAKTSPTAGAESNDSTDAGLEAELTKSDKEIEAVSNDQAATNSSLNDSQTDLSE